MKSVARAHLANRPAVVTRWYEAAMLAMLGYRTVEIAERFGVSDGRVREMIAAAAGEDFLASVRAREGQ